MAYQRWWKTIRDQQGNAVNGASCAVYEVGTAVTATIYDPNSDDASPSPISNPFITTANGVFGFMAADGEYDVQISGGNGATQQYRVTLNAENMGTSSADSLRSDLAATTGAEMVGYLAPYTGAVARTQAIKNSWSVSTYDFMSATQISAVVAGTSTDDTACVQKALDSGAGIVTIKKGTYMIDAVTKLVVPSNIKLVFEEGAILKAITNSSGSYAILFIAGTNVTVDGAHLIGERLTHTGVTGEAGFGITTSGSNIKILNGVFEECWGDGVYIGNGAHDVFVSNCEFKHNRRMGLTITNAWRVWVKDCYAYNSVGTAPQSGFAIEPDVNTDTIDDITFENCVTDSCTGGFGFYCNLNTFTGADKNINIKYIKCKDKLSATGLNIANVKTSANILNGQILVDSFVSDSSVQAGIQVFNYQAVRTPLLRILNPTIINTNTGANTITYGAAINVDRGPSADVAPMGNMIIEGAASIDTRVTKLTRATIFATDAQSIDFQDAIFKDPIRVDSDSLTPVVTFYNWKVRDANRILTYLNATQFNYTVGTYGISFLNNLGSVVAITPYTLNQTVNIDCPMTFRNDESVGLRITPPIGCKILPLSTVAGKYIQTTVIGASVTIRRFSSTIYYIENLYGTWTVEP